MKQKPERDPLLDEEMPSVVRRGLQQFRETPPPNPAAWQATRTAFLTEAQELASERVTFLPVVRRKGWVRRTLHARIPAFKEANPMIALLKIALIFSLMTGAGVGTVNAAQGSLPGAPLYQLKLAWEDAQSSLATTPEARLERALTMAQERVREMQQLTERAQDIPAGLVERYALHLNIAIKAMGELPEAAQEQTRARIQERLALHEQVLEQVRERLQQRDGDETAVREMAGILKRTRDRVQDPAGEPPANRPPEPQQTPNPEAPAPGPGGPGAGPGGPNPTATAPGANPTEPAPGPGEPGAGPGPNPTETAPGAGEPGAGPGPNPTETAPGAGEPGAGPGEPGAGPEPAPGPGEPGAGPGPNPTEPAPTSTPGHGRP